MAGDGVKTVHFWKRIFSKENAKQASTIAGGAAITAGSALQSSPSIWAQLAGMALVALGGAAVGHNGNP